MSNPNSSESSPLSASGVPSSFDSSPEFFEESRTQKLWRKLKQEPLIPIGCLATCYALYQATKSIRLGDKTQTNRMFRARVYAQGFTLLALVAGSIFYQDERMKRKKFEEALEEKKSSEKREKWLRELEARDKEDREWRERIEGMNQNVQQSVKETKESIGKARQSLKNTSEDIKTATESKFSTKSARDDLKRDGWAPAVWILRTREAWRRV